MGTIHHPLALNRESQEDEIFIVMSKLYLFSYLIDGRYDIDNSIAERFIRVNARTRCSLLAAAWQMYRQPIIRCSQHAETGCLLWNISRNSSTKLSKGERIMKICCP